MKREHGFHIGEPIRHHDCIGICRNWNDGGERGEETVAEILPSQDGNRTQRKQARLLAASQDLLDAVNHVLTVAERGSFATDIDWQMLRDAVAKTKASKKKGAGK